MSHRQGSTRSSRVRITLACVRIPPITVQKTLIRVRKTPIRVPKTPTRVRITPITVRITRIRVRKTLIRRNVAPARLHKELTTCGARRDSNDARPPRARPDRAMQSKASQHSAPSALQRRKVRARFDRNARRLPRGRGALRHWAAQACMPTVLSSRFAARSPSATCTSARSAVGPGRQRHCPAHPRHGEREGGSAAHRPDVLGFGAAWLTEWAGSFRAAMEWESPPSTSTRSSSTCGTLPARRANGARSAAALWAARVEVRHSASGGVCSARHARKLCTVQRTKCVHHATTTDADAVVINSAHIT
jgi:hypothetical protein